MTNEQLAATITVSIMSIPILSAEQIYNIILTQLNERT